MLKLAANNTVKRRITAAVVLALVDDWSFMLVWFEVQSILVFPLEIVSKDSANDAGSNKSCKGS